MFACRSGAHGIEEAALTYFKVHAHELSLGQGAMLAGVIQGPSRLSPRSNLPGARKRQEWVLAQMVDHDFITAHQAQAAEAENIVINRDWPLKETIAPYYVEAVRQEMVKTLGEEEFRAGGYKVYTALDRSLQCSSPKSHWPISCAGNY